MASPCGRGRNRAARRRQQHAREGNLAFRGIDCQIAHGATFHNDRPPDLKAGFILADPPFDPSNWGGESLGQDKRWQYGARPEGNATIVSGYAMQWRNHSSDYMIGAS